MTNGDSTSVLLVDDHGIFRHILKEYLQNVPNINVVGEAENGYAAVQLAQELHPNVIIMDINMPVMDGIEATRTITANIPGIKIIGLSFTEENYWIEKIYKAGASYFLSKSCGFDQIVSAINKVVQAEELCIETIESKSC